MRKSRCSAIAMRDIAYIALGSNLGDRERFLELARSELERLPRTKLLASTDPEETPPLGPRGQRPYLNQIVAGDTDTALGDRDAISGGRSVAVDDGWRAARCAARCSRSDAARSDRRRHAASRVVARTGRRRLRRTGWRAPSGRVGRGSHAHGRITIVGS